MPFVSVAWIPKACRQSPQVRQQVAKAIINAMVRACVRAFVRQRATRHAASGRRRKARTAWRASVWPQGQGPTRRTHGCVCIVGCSLSSLTHAHPRRHAATLRQVDCKEAEITADKCVRAAVCTSPEPSAAQSMACCPLPSERSRKLEARASTFPRLCGFAVWGFATRAHAAHLAPIDPPVPAPARVPLMTTYPSLTQVCVMLCEQGGGALRRVAGQLGAARGPHARERRQAAQGRQVTHACLARAPSIKEQCMCL